MRLTKHENQTFANQTVYISGQAFINCQFTGCTLVLRETLYHLENCVFDRCNWHIDLILMWGSGESIMGVKNLVAMLERAQAESEQQEGGIPPANGAGEMTTGGGEPGPSPFAP